MSSPDIRSVSPVLPPSGLSQDVGRQGGVESGKELPQTVSGQSGRPSQESVDQAVVQISDFVQNIARELQFQVDDVTGNTLITVTDSDTQEVIRQIPSEEVVALAQYIAESGDFPLKGALLNSES
ncbi:flagellar protein FlaG [Porticoccus sp. GXU_MW_L64]